MNILFEACRKILQTSEARMQVKAFQCVCGFKVRAMLTQGCAAAFRPDPEAWQKLCAYSNQVHVPQDCPPLSGSNQPIHPNQEEQEEVARNPPASLLSPEVLLARP